MSKSDFYHASAAFYDDDYAAMGRSEDIAFYRDLAVESGGPVLEMGCGTGRILLPIARTGIEIHGLDASPAMLARLREKLAAEPEAVQARVALSEGDLRSTKLGRRFRLVTAPFRVAQHLIERSDQRAWLRNVADQLAPGGWLCFDVFQPNFSYIARGDEPMVDVDRTGQDGKRVRRVTRLVHTPEFQRFEMQATWQVLDSAGHVQNEHSERTVLRWFTRAELENLLELEGFEVMDYWGSFTREPFGPGAREQVIRARRANSRALR